MADRKITDPAALKAISHPLRRRLFRLLIQLGPATVGTLADKVGGDPGQISYHLRELARYGFIEEAPELAADRRQRWWRSVPGTSTWDSRDFTGPEARAIADTLKAQMLSEETERAAAYERARDAFGEEWSRAATSTQSSFFLTPAELTELNAEFQELMRKWSAVGRAAREEGRTEGREVVFLYMHNFPERP